MKQIKYIEKKTKYQIVEEYQTKLDLVGYTIDTLFIKLTPIGVLTIRAGYAWDGASGPTIDTKSSMRGSLEHDALYQLMRMELLPQSERDYADDRLEQTCKEDDMLEFRAEAWNDILDKLGAAAADPKNNPEILIAP